MKDSFWWHHDLLHSQDASTHRRIHILLCLRMLILYHSKRESRTQNIPSWNAYIMLWFEQMCCEDHKKIPHYSIYNSRQRRILLKCLNKLFMNVNNITSPFCLQCLYNKMTGLVQNNPILKQWACTNRRLCYLIFEKCAVARLFGDWRTENSTKVFSSRTLSIDKLNRIKI